MPKESITSLTLFVASSHLIFKGCVIIVAFTRAGECSTVVSKVFGNGVSEVVGKLGTLVIVSMDGWKVAVDVGDSIAAVASIAAFIQHLSKDSSNVFSCHCVR